MLEAYKKIEKERAELGIPPEPLDAEQTADLVELIKENSDDGELLLDLLINRVPAGVDDAAYVKAAFLNDIATKKITCDLIDPTKATFYLGTMLGGYNVEPLINLLDDDECGNEAVKALSQTLLVFDAFNDVAEKSKDSSNAAKVLKSWAEAEWFTSKPEVPQSITTTVFKVPGETNTDDLSPAPDAWSRPDIPLHALAMYKMPRQGLSNDPLGEIKKLKEKGHPVCLVGDVVGTGSSRKSATNSVLWHMGDDIPFIPNKRTGGICIGTKIAPIFFNTMEDAGTLVFEADVEKMESGDVITIFPHEGKIENESSENISSFELKSETFLDEVRAGGRIPLIIGRSLTDKARDFLNLPATDVFVRPGKADESNDGYTLAQKIVGKACGVEGIRPGTYCEPIMTTVGSQDTTGPMTRDELKELACLGFTSDLVMQSFCHTAAYPKPVDIETQHTLPEFIKTRGGVALQPGDGIIHSWLNRMLLPDTVGTGGDSHTRFPIGISFPAGSGLVAFGAALGVIPLDMPESVLVRFSGEMQPGITLRDLVNAIPYAAIQKGLLTVEKEGKKNIFSGRCLEIEGLPNLKIEQAFELSDASAERSASGCTVLLDEEPILEYLKSNIVLLRWLISEGYGDARTLERRAQKMEQWIQNPVLLKPDNNAKYAATIEIDLNEIKEPLLACPNDPDDIKTLSEIGEDKIDEVFIGSCMTNIGHFRAAGKLLKDTSSLPTRLWISPPTRMDKFQLEQEGFYDIFKKAGVRTEVPGCSLCMGNQARVEPNATVVSTSTRNFPNRLGDGADVYLASAELAAISSILGKLPTNDEYQSFMSEINTMSADIFRYMNFNEIKSYKDAADNAKLPAVTIESN
ncbi:MAG: bifunctional aconitate hydratase 2/2-methylisocitrate dehydratase [Gammaproteobacteria bacterium]|mgnify:CR=1 FL=1|jgi:aconitate hydratase 2/2-methylisocitrate dehydratase|nr:bifunctional aconitate hydratase 2/2-methylisocitrate dehydratase [Pseudomonadota bacterium]GIR52414.1 MAG: aconitate hydratase B [Gammaproteobacteria bacterium]|tara:strand:- start:6151 stop:8730 length:2580 start_codon:yes stop_codon:yes gene_type:complete